MKQWLAGTFLAGATLMAATFPAEIAHPFPTLTDVRCVAAGVVGSAQGLAVYEKGAFRTLDKAAVEACAGPAESLYYISGGALQKRNAGKVAALPAGAVRSLAVAGDRVLLATDKGLFQLSGAKFAPVTTAAADIRQVALAPSGAAAIAAANGLYVLAGSTWSAVFPREGARSWAPIDVRGVAFDSQGRLWFASPQGAGMRDGQSWKLFTGLEGLPYDDFTTVAAGENGVMWFGTKKGAIRYDGSTWAYRQGMRWLPNDEVRSIAVDSNGDAWIATAKGAGWIERKPTTLAEKAKFYEDEIDRYHRRTEYEYVGSVHLTKTGDKSTFKQSDSDNDGLWTSMYGAGECYAYAATKDPQAKKRARKAFEALRFLSQVTQGGEHPAPPGFPARSILPTSGPDPNIHDSRERDVRNQASRDSEWKVMSPRWPKSADGKWYWKSDTSSDELDGHYFFYARYYDLVAETPQEKDDVRQVVKAITDHMIDHDLELVDWDGKHTRWGVFGPSLNTYKHWWADRGLDSLTILSFLKVAQHMTGDAKYQKVYDKLVREHGFATNAMITKVTTGPGSGNQSDDEMAFMNYYNLILYENDPELRSRYAYSLANYWGVERPEMNPFFNFVAVSSLKGLKYTSPYQTTDLTAEGDWLADSLDTLRRLPLDRIDWGHDNTQRKDLVHLRAYTPEDEEMAGSGYRRNGKVLPADERFFSFWNHNPYRLHTGGSGNGLSDGAVFLLPYYMGLYHRYIEN